MAQDVRVGKMSFEMAYEPTASQNGAIGAEPKLGIERQEIAPGGKVFLERFERIIHTRILLYNGVAPFEKSVCFMAREEE